MTKQAATDAGQRKLIGLLERPVWNPILRASPAGYSRAAQSRLERVQRKTATQRDRYRNYRGAGEVRQRFQEDLRSRAAKSTNADLRKLDLPIQSDVADEFFVFADRLGVSAERRTRRRRRPHPRDPSRPKRGSKSELVHAATRRRRAGTRGQPAPRPSPRRRRTRVV
jgi:hypothetical protein